jgi:hypothetical protein
MAAQPAAFASGIFIPRARLHNAPSSNPRHSGTHMQEIIERHLTAEQRMMRDTIRSFVDKKVTPFVRANWKKEWDTRHRGARAGDSRGIWRHTD